MMRRASDAVSCLRARRERSCPHPQLHLRQQGATPSAARRDRATEATTLRVINGTLLQGNHMVVHATVLYRRWVLDTVGGFDSLVDAAEDDDLYLRIARECPVCS